MTAHITSHGAHPRSHPGVALNTDPLPANPPSFSVSPPRVRSEWLSRCNRRLAAAVLLSAALAGCGDGALTKAEKRYEFLKEQQASYGEVCDAGREWVRALSVAQDERYSLERGSVEVDCLTGDMKGRWRSYGLPDVEADNMEALADEVSTPGPGPVPRSSPSPIAAKPEPVEACWQDYCPCEETGTTDRMLCRNLQGGVEVTPDMFASGAAMRDARNSMREWNRANPEQAIPVEGDE